MMLKTVLKSGLLVLLLTLVGCETVSKTASSLTNKLSFGSNKGQTYRATGYATISQQLGRTTGEKVINAIEASKANAYKELVAMVHGRYITSTSSVHDKVIVTNTFRIAEAGVVRGARVIKSYPIQDDVYATILEIDSNQLQKAWIVNNN